MDLATLSTLKEDVMFDFIHGRTRLYQSSKALCEYAIREALLSLHDSYIASTRYPDMPGMIDRLRHTYHVQFNFDSLFRLIITPRNAREHNPERAPITDHSIRKSILLCYNDLITSLEEAASISMLEFHIDDNLFHDIAPLTFVNSANQDWYVERARIAQSNIERLKRRIRELENSTGNTSQSGNYEQKSEIITAKNNIKRNEINLITSRVQSGPNKRIAYPQATIGDAIHIGLTKRERGFAVLGLEISPICTHQYRHIFAVIYGILLSSSVYHPSEYLRELESKTRRRFNYASILRYQFIVLLMIKNNYFPDRIEVSLPDGDRDEFIFAANDIFNYAAILARLCNLAFQKPEICFAQECISISLNNHSDSLISVQTLNDGPIGTITRGWYESPILFDFNLDNENQEDILYLLRNVFLLREFKKGQAEVLCALLGSSASSITVMPTSSGKSLLYYFLAVLSPLPTLVVSPTNELIEDQMRMLKEAHSFDSCCFLDEKFDYSNYEFETKINFVKPEVFMNASFTGRISEAYSSGVLSTLVIDEIHCASNWSHDYRPAYLMLGNYIRQYLSNIRVVGFTATTTHKVTKSLLKQFDIRQEDIHEPIQLKREDIWIEFRSFTEDSEMTRSLTESLISNRTRSLVFTKDHRTSQSIFQTISSNNACRCDIYSDRNKDSYYDFVSGNTDILITDYRLGIGINFPSVEASIHVGYPYSRNSMVQEVGRVAREGKGGNASVYVRLISSLQVYERRLLDFSTPIDDIIKTITTFNESSSDIINSYINIMGHLEEKGIFLQNTLEVYRDLSKQAGKETRILHFASSNLLHMIEMNQIHMHNYLILLQNIGVIEEWFGEGVIQEGHFYTIKVSPYATNVSEIKTIAVQFLRLMDSDENTIRKVKSQDTIDGLVEQYINWYYTTYMLHHREQFLNMINMISANIGEHSMEDVFSIENDFSLAYAQMEKTIQIINERFMADLILEMERDFDPSMIRVAEKCIETEYDIKLDMLLLWRDAKNDTDAFFGRLKRIINNADTVMRNEFKSITPHLLRSCSSGNKILFLDWLLDWNNPVVDLERLYQGDTCDFPYIVMFAKILNRRMERNPK